MILLQALESVCDANVAPAALCARCAAELTKEIQQTVQGSINQALEASFSSSETLRKKRRMCYFSSIAFLNLAYSQIQRLAKICTVIYCWILEPWHRIPGLGSGLFPQTAGCRVACRDAGPLLRHGLESCPCPNLVSNVVEGRGL